jgi:hypothetical protein
VICTELKDNPGMSVTNSAERIAGEVISFHRLPTLVIWVEHYQDGARGTKEDPHTFHLVTFSSYEVEELGSYMGEERKRIGEPSWKPLDRATVEALSGSPSTNRRSGQGFRAPVSIMPLAALCGPSLARLCLCPAPMP